ncbi:transcriptional regulator [Porphyromonas crevioricanis]|uniref:Transcriptional activator protein CopR n=2 Tax=Porphyromonas crevioricanis TaxID=393921 RepID=A0A0A2FD13_9PORP|nr:response regulator transcription factor [Porphyromonas crevioricanis]KGN88916.1 transcriptional regulator [Porphyromonas crevioricanis]KGN95811.1 transcriptional regulator [Porphyromonas crevioricanis]SJZ74688.1 DNA-binding response regulator, OmpR family, contains REC and winged-helix (wHTH) domain [Porphyromonas crevioricanis]SQH73441.1 Transcriptional activator protein CopR [Porphyromonas crevioricanis]GAD04936.1 transcriptional regulatory protein rprY [Porphyromonas crevioricanis JCM 15
MEEQMKIFFCEDDESLGLLLKEFFISKGFDVDLFTDGELGIEGFPKSKYDLCILDIMMPKKDGFEVAEYIRSVNMDIPIVFLSARDVPKDRLKGFQVGADDYLTKPFSMEELLLRIEAIMRRINGRKAKAMPFYQIGKYHFDTLNQTLEIGGKVTKLTTKESELLNLLCMYVNNTLERDFALRTVWHAGKTDIDSDDYKRRSIDVYVTKLRKLLKDDPSITIRNVHGKGYRLVTPINDIEENTRKL